MSLEALQGAAEGIEVPEGLRSRVEDRLLAETVLADREERRAGTVRLWYWAAAAAAAVALILMLSPSRGPRDTYSDPALAYERVEDTFRLISEKASGGIRMARVESDAVLEQLNNNLNIIKK